MKEIIEALEGHVICIGLDEKYTSLVEKNNKIISCDLLGVYNRKEKKQKGIKGKNIQIKKIRKVYKKKKVNYLLCNYEVIQPYLRSFVKNSVYINSGQTIYYQLPEIDNLAQKYKRYGATSTREGSFLKIDNTKSKTNFFKDIIYNIVDVVEYLIEIIGDILMS